MQIQLTEHRPSRLPRETLTTDQGAALYTMFRDYVEVLFPSPATDGMWQITFRGWIGALRLDRDTEIVITPKVPLANVGRMLRYAFQLPIDVFDGLVECTSITDLYEQLVRALAREAFKLARQGLHHEYRTRRKSETAIKGRIDIPRALRQPASESVPCVTSERTAEIAENQIVMSALDFALRGDLCSDPARAILRQAYRQLGHGVSVRQFDRRALPCFSYSRLTERYKPAHALARFVLMGHGAAAAGDRTSMPFLLNMPRLFEMFVARYLAEHLPDTIATTEQKHWSVGSTNRLDFYVDVVLRDTVSGKTCGVLDTKYKDYGYPATADVAQVAYYSLLEECALAGIVTPTAGGEWYAESGGVHIFRSVFDLSDDMDRAGRAFVDEIIARVGGVPGQPSPRRRSVA